MQYAVPRLEQLSIDVSALQAKRDRLVSALREIGYEVASPEGTFYLWPRSPVPDDEAFVAELERRGVLVMPGMLFETPGWFRICLTATSDTIEAAIPRLRDAYVHATGGHTVAT
jgi:aspartate aminotransferase